MVTTHSHSPREQSPRRAENAVLDPAVWQQILQTVRAQHPSLNRVWFDQLSPRQLTNGVIQITVATPGHLNFCQHQCQQPFTSGTHTITPPLIPATFHYETPARGGVFNEGDQPLPL